MAAAPDRAPALTLVIPTFNNEAVLRECLASWQQFGGDAVEIVVVEDGCRDGTAAFLTELAATPWGARQLRWIHQDDGHELRCTNAGMAIARGDLVAAWQDDMVLRAAWLVPELLATFAAYAELGLLSLSRGLNCLPVSDPIETWTDLVDWRRLQSTIGPGPGNWFRLQEVDIVIRPWIVRRACLDRVGPLDEAFRPTEWDEADLAYRIREAGWTVATCGYERLGAYWHKGSTTIGVPSPAYLERVLRNGRLFHERWDATIARQHPRQRRAWTRRATGAGWLATARSLLRSARGKSQESNPKSQFPTPKNQEPESASAPDGASAGPATSSPGPDGQQMQTGVGRNYREPSWLERLVSGSAGRAPAWLRAPMKRAYNVLLAALPGDHLICRLPGGETLRVDPEYRHLSWNAEEYEALKRETRPGATVLDVGANVGCYTMLLAGWAGESGHVYAFEPAAASRAGLERHLALNGLSARVSVRREAVSDRAGDAPFVDAGTHGDNRLVPANTPGTTTVPSLSIDGFCDEADLTPDVIKIDIEGAELAALRGARGTIARRGPALALFVELHPAIWPSLGVTRADIEEELRRQDLSIDTLPGVADAWTVEGVCVRLRHA